MAKEAHVAFILEKLNSGVVDAKLIISDFCSKFQKTERTFWTKWKIAQKEYQIQVSERNKQVDSITTSKLIESVSNGLKSKSQRMDNLQKQIDDLNAILESGKTKDAIIDDKTLSYLDIERSLTAVEKATLMKTIKDLNAELNKMDGSYAPTKVDSKNETNGVIRVVRE